MIAIRSSRRGALWAALLLWPLVLVATITTPGAADQADLRQMIMAAAFAWPGLALLGAGLAPAAMGSRIDAVVAGIALGIGAPVAAITSTLIGLAIIYLFSSTGATAGEALGTTIRLGVLGAMRLAPFVAIAVAVWLFVVRQVRIRPTS